MSIITAPFTKHAACRLTERTSLEIENFIDLINKGLYINLGSKPGIHKQHLLIYSDIDNEFFVAIIDSYCGSIITVLTLDYHEMLAWRVPERDKNELLKKTHDHENYSRLASIKEENTKTIITALIFLDNEGKPKAKTVLQGKQEDVNVGESIFEIVYKDKFLAKINEKLKTLDAINIFGLSVRYGKKSPPIFFDLKQLGLWVNEDNSRIFVQ